MDAKLPEFQICRSTDSPPDLSARLAADGFAIIDRLADEATLAEIANETASASIEPRESAQSRVRRRNGTAYAVRNLFQLAPSVSAWAKSDSIQSLVSSVIGGARPVRAILFDKTPTNNWKVAWHQDLSIAVLERFDVPGFGPWSIKAGVPHVQPPGTVLERMLTIRLNLDDCDEHNGPLRVIPGSHREGVLSPMEVARRSEGANAALCCGARGSGLFMHPLLLHASSPATVPGHRRVVHVEFAATELPPPLRWHFAPN